MNTTAQIYALRDPRTGQVRYVGKTSQELIRRLWAHENSAKRHPKWPVQYWIRKLRRLGLRPKIVLLEVVPYDQWQEAERKWIAFFRAQFGRKLLNLSAGGDGVDIPHTKEWHAKIGAARRGQKASEETKAKLRAINLTTHCKRGHVWTPENTLYANSGGRSWRVCKICNNANQRNWRLKTGKIKGRLHQHCKFGHPLQGVNLRILVRRGRTERICRECVRIRNRKAKAKKRGKSQHA